ncbi:hypothetical protein TRFO_19448 [Tritrichomonas foetus]|uniref:Uncharacterized protein n=1 Tax=Tritrichomonas foetus TaxID=1144522 RepID=A0A1J4KNQ1_9EUKA|nr:hypothetical protein TRFO_19448 [Tritrichomonas foetus]|eukprot:OHT11045.1 hypothetical protein TRFO_19448 [Tritrichomonas foetus]
MTNYIFNLGIRKMLFERLPKLWHDYENLTNLEKTISEVDIKILYWNTQTFSTSDVNESPSKSSFNKSPFFTYNGCKYMIKHIVPQYTREESILPFLFADSTFDDFHLMFGIQSPFFLITPFSGRIDENESRSLMRALSSIEKHPIIMKLTNKEDSKYLGSFRHKNKIIKFTSRTEYDSDSPEFSSLESILKIANQITKNAQSNKNTTSRNTQTNQRKKLQHKGTPMNGNQEAKNEMSFSARMIFHIDLKNELPILLCGEWPEMKDGSLSIDFEKAPRHIIAFETGQKDASDLHGAYAIVEAHDPDFHFTNDKRLLQSEPDFLEESTFPCDMEIGIDFCPSDTILTNLAEVMLVCENFDYVWQNFLNYVRKCVNKGEFIKYVSYSTVNHKFCLLYQKLQMINICLSKMTNEMKTSNYAITSDVFNDLEKCIEMEICSNTNVKFDKYETKKMMESVLSFKSQNDKNKSTIDDFLKTQKKSLHSLAKIVWRIIPYSLFDLQSQREIAFDYIESLKPSEVLQPLVFLLLCENFNDLISMRNNKFDSLQSMICELRVYLNCLKDEMPILTPQMFSKKCREIDFMLMDLTNATRKKNFGNTKILELKELSTKCGRITEALKVKGFAVAENSYEKVTIDRFLNRMIDDRKVSQDIQLIVNTSHVECGEKIIQRTFVHKHFHSEGCVDVIVATSTIEDIVD